MKCMHCGADLPEDQLICPSCGREIQIVPDYNPLDDMLTAQLKGGITQTMSVHLGEQEKQSTIRQTVQSRQLQVRNIRNRSRSVKVRRR